MASKYSDHRLENFIPVNVSVTGDKLKEVIQEMNETPELKEQCLHEFRALIKDQDLSCITSDEFLLRFLRAKKFQLQQSFELLQNYVNSRRSLHEGLVKLKPEILQRCLQNTVIGILPYRDNEGRPILFYRLGVWNQDLCQDDEMAMIALVILHYLSEDPIVQLKGLPGIYDHNCFSLANVTFMMRQMNPMRKLIFKCLPIRLSGSYLINDSGISHCILQIVLAVLPQKVKERTFCYGKDYTPMFQRLSQDILPTEFGGTCGSLNNDHLMEIMESYLQKMKNEQPYFLEQDSIRL